MWLCHEPISSMRRGTMYVLSTTVLPTVPGTWEVVIIYVLNEKMNEYRVK